MFSFKFSKNLIVGLLGNTAEWYDYAIFNFLSTVLAKKFFPESNIHISEILTFMIFSVGFFSRPIGALLFGYIGDTISRKKALFFSTALMSLSTMVIGILPTYTEIGVFSTILLALMRIMQGISVGGTLPGSLVVLNNIKKKNNSLILSLPIAGSFLGFAFGALVSLLLSAIFTDEAINEYAWRYPFFLSLILGCIAFYIKNNVIEANSIKCRKLYFKKVTADIKPLILSILVLSIPPTFFYTNLVFLASTLSTHMGYSQQKTLYINIIAMLTMFITSIYAGKYYEPYCKKRIIYILNFILSLMIVPIFFFMSINTPLVSLFFFFIGSAILGSYFGIIPSFLLALPKNHEKYTFIALSYSVAFALFGGTAPTIVTLITYNFSNLNMISVYLLIICMISCFSLYFLKWDNINYGS